MVRGVVGDRHHRYIATQQGQGVICSLEALDDVLANSSLVLLRGIHHNLHDQTDGCADAAKATVRYHCLAAVSDVHRIVEFRPAGRWPRKAM